MDTNAKLWAWAEWLFLGAADFFLKTIAIVAGLVAVLLVGIAASMAAFGVSTVVGLIAVVFVLGPIAGMRYVGLKLAAAYAAWDRKQLNRAVENGWKNAEAK